ncbi:MULTISPECIES: recombinase family protein [Mycobacterium avium complex (MAC)]|jgi:DNA invertase Pin-like site-specific DNA recombinase|nr:MULTISPECIES: recombinase family protein [Mycobacterium avium complex (MAC)]APT10262.1 resolvase [Mycobacterium avium subsp. hominissuis]AXO24267.1 resolvase [Mycobacterium avium subsp. hominissuis]ETZ55496.1 resolvase, N terminal domain protein [Mycobacterium avium MAV_120809_2495]ETZ57571.1 resolvase, N terminal domain protein [Mycobacterium sp. MAC_011194_8550]ETZ60168.1 resolvase, N terminal domain protein [Mycobacterium sp. MAC_080597_8934]
MTAPRTRRRTQTAPAGTVVAYVRVSTEEQAASGAGLDAQRAAIAAECDRRGWTVVGWYADEGVSGGKALDARPALTAALNTVETAQAAVLMVAKSDRLARSLPTLLHVIDRAERAGGVVVAVDGTVDTSTAAGRFTTQIMGSVAELERGLISDRTKAALAVRKAQGVRLGRPTTVPSSVVDRIAAERAAGATWAAIADGLNADGTPTGQGGSQWFPNTVARIAKRAVAVPAT